MTVTPTRGQIAAGAQLRIVRPTKTGRGDLLDAGIIRTMVHTSTAVWPWLVVDLDEPPYCPCAIRADDVEVIP